MQNQMNFTSLTLFNVSEEDCCMARVLVVEDEIPVLLFAEFVLEGLGHSIVSTSSQTGALALLETEDLDVLFTDIRLPENNLAGFELARQARERHPSLKVLYTTGQTVDDQMTAYYVEGAAMLPKPYTDYALKNALEGVLNAA
jgi:CheY-like chemotaxis protein